MEKELQHMVVRVHCIEWGLMRVPGWWSRICSRTEIVW